MLIDYSVSFFSSFLFNMLNRASQFRTKGYIRKCVSLTATTKLDCRSQFFVLFLTPQILKLYSSTHAKQLSLSSII